MILKNIDSRLFPFLVLYLKTLVIKNRSITLKEALPKAFSVLKNNSNLVFQQSIQAISAAYNEAVEGADSFDSELFEELRAEFIKTKNDDNLNSFKLEAIHPNMKLRLAPNPNSSPAVGSLRMICIHKYFAVTTNCKILIRFDDTDPDNKPSRLCCYQTLLAACDWAGLQSNCVISASKRPEVYQEVLELLIQRGWVYSNTDESDRLEGIHNTPAQNLTIWVNRHNTTSVAFRFKSDGLCQQLNNWVCYRRVHNKHTLKSNEFTPTVNFQSTVDDFKEDVSHMLRGLDLESTEHRQRELWAALNDSFGSCKLFPTVKYWGRLSVPGTISSSSKINKALDSDTSYASNSFMNFSTVHSFRIPFDGVYKYFLESGFSRAEHKVNLKKLRSYCLKSLNRPIIRPTLSEKTTQYPIMFSNQTLILSTIVENVPSMNLTYKIGQNYLIFNQYLNNYFVLV